MKSNILKTGITLVLLAFLFTINANAQSSEKKQRGEKLPSIEKLLKKMDVNEDGKLSLKEVKGPLRDDFSKIDANKDGFLSKEELEKAPKPKGRKPQKRRQ